MLTLAIAAAITFAPIAHTDPPSPSPIIGIDTAYASDYYRDALLAHGFRGIPGDGAEIIYVPQADAIALCGSDLDCELASGIAY